MATQVNALYTEKGETYSTEPIVVTIALEEYRSLVEENERLKGQIENLNNSINQISIEKERAERVSQRLLSSRRLTIDSLDEAKEIFAQEGKNG